MVKTARVSSFPDLKEKFDKESERVLVLPIWIKFPFLSAERQRHPVIFIFDEPLFLTVKELPKLPTIIPGKTSVILMGISTAMGRTVFLDSVVIISETGKMFTIFCPEITWGTVRCDKYFDNSDYSEEWKDDLVAAIQDSTGKVCYPRDSKSSSYMGQGARRCEISYSKKEKQSILNFLDGIKSKIETDNLEEIPSIKGDDQEEIASTKDDDQEEITYIKIGKKDTFYKEGTFYAVDIGDILEVLQRKPCGFTDQQCWEVLNLLTGKSGYLTADQVQSNHHVYTRKNRYPFQDR